MSTGLATCWCCPRGDRDDRAAATGACGDRVHRHYAPVQAIVAGLSGFRTHFAFLRRRLTGASLFAITLLALPLADKLRESEARVQQRDLDLANLSELDEFIVQRLRESILVVDAEDRIRLIDDRVATAQGGEGIRTAAARRGLAAPSLPARVLAPAGIRSTRHDHRSRLRRRRHGGPAAVRAAVAARTRAGARSSWKTRARWPSASSSQSSQRSGG